MTNIIVVSFADETRAIEASHKLTELDSFGDISIYEKVMVRKKANGECEVLTGDNFEGWRTLAGMGVGSLLGLLGGPVGLVVGLYTGTVVGAMADMGHYDFADDFLTRTKDKLAAGTVSIIAEISEDNEAFVDASLKPFGAVITRSEVDVEFNQYVNDQIEKIEDDIAEERAALKTAIGNERTKIQSKIAELKEKRRAAVAGFVSTARHIEKNIKDRATTGFEKVKSDVREVISDISSEVNEEKAYRISQRIARYEAKLKGLNKQLKELSPGLVKQD